MYFSENIFLILLFFPLLCLILKDIKDGIIPDLCVMTIALLGLLQNHFQHVLSAFILGGCAYSLYALYPLMRKTEGLGFGDVKLMAAIGFWLSLFQIPLFLVATGAMGIITHLIWRYLKKGPTFPLGPALALALGICIVGEYAFSKGEENMTFNFSGPSLSPSSGEKPTSIVVLIHGYGSNGDDLISLGKAWSSLLPHTLFVAPHGPTVCEMNPAGNQWFDLRDWDPARIIKETQAITPAFNQYLDHLLKVNDLGYDRLALVGFSQGAMLALHIGLHRPQCAGVVAYSGAFLQDPLGMLVARPSVLLVHGQEDDVLADSFSVAAGKSLKALGVPVTLSLLPGLGHGIDERGLQLGGDFLKKHLDENQRSDLWNQTKESKS